jgi:hypothetical protein
MKKFKNDDQYAALLNLLCAPEISIEPSTITEGENKIQGYELKINMPNVAIEKSKKEFECYLVSKASFNTKISRDTSMMASCDYLLSYKIKTKPITIDNAESKATQAFSLFVSHAELENLALDFILNVAAILKQAYPNYSPSRIRPLVPSEIAFDSYIKYAADGIHSKMGSLLGANSLFGIYAKGRFSGDNFSLPNKLMSQVREGGQQVNETDWDEMILGSAHAYVTQSKMLSFFGSLSDSELEAKAKEYANNHKPNKLVYESFMTGTSFQIGCADDVECWMVQE